MKEIKENILRALNGKKILSCPKCSHSVFLRKLSSRVEIIEEEDSLLDNMVDGVEECVYICANCNEEIDEDMMIKNNI